MQTSTRVVLILSLLVSVVVSECTFKVGGTVFDISKLAQSKAYEISDSDYKFFLNPCGPVESSCPAGTAVCRRWGLEEYSWVSLGMWDNKTVTDLNVPYLPHDGKTGFTVKFFGGGEIQTSTRSSVLSFICDSIAGTVSAKQWKGWIFSPVQ
jgi:hypothetical protein